MLHAPGDSAVTGPSPAPLWTRHASQWAYLTPPLRPGPEDMAVAQDTVDRWSLRHAAAPVALILGVTPELVGRRWPPGSRVVAADRSMPMIRTLWPAPASPDHGLSALQADWLALPLPDGSCDIVFGDGSFTAIPSNQALALARGIRRVLAADGVVTVRVFVRPDHDESPDAVWADMVERQIGNFGIFKFRLLMSLCRESGDVAVADAWRCFHQRCPSPEELAAHLGWPVAALRTIEAYRGQRATLWYPTVTEFRAAIAPVLHEVACIWPSYEMGDRCPTFVLGAGG